MIKTIWMYWRKFGMFIANIVNFVVLLFFYFTVIGATSVIGKMLGKKFMPLDECKWHDIEKRKKEDFERQF